MSNRDALSRSYGGRRTRLVAASAEEIAHARRVDEILHRILVGGTVVQFPQKQLPMPTELEAA